MPVEGYVEYKRREYCNAIECPVQMLMNSKGEGSEEYEKLREICKNRCLHTTYEFHHWLTDNGFIVIKPEEKGGNENGLGNEESPGTTDA
jgi:hypothetical protein